MIGVFDSGVGGLTVLKHFIKDLPDYDYIYLGDNARVPYGNKSAETIYNYTCQAVEFLFSKNCQLVILACNTASAQALRRIQQEYLPANFPNRRVLGVIRPLAEAAAEDQNVSRVGVIGTKSTIFSEVYLSEIHKLNPSIKVYSKATPLLVPLIEENWLDRPETRMILRKYLRVLKTKQVQSLILGCTHYPFLLEMARKIMGKRCFVYDPGELVSKSLGQYILRHKELDIKPNKSRVYKFYTTDDINKFRELGEKFLGMKIVEIEKISLD